MVTTEPPDDPLESNDSGWPRWEKLLKSVSRIKLRGGVVGKISTVLLVTTIAIAAICWSFPNLVVALVGIGVVCLLVLTLGLRMLSFAEKNPYAATLEGAELLVHQQIQLGMKGQPVLQVDPEAMTTEPGVALIPMDPATVNQPDEPEDVPAALRETGDRTNG